MASGQIRLASVRATFFALAILTPARAQDAAYRIFTNFTGRYHCSGEWRDFNLKIQPGVSLLGIADFDEDATAVLSFYFHRSVTSLDGATYALKGPYDAKTGHFHFEPLRWTGPHPEVFEMIGIDGTFNSSTRHMTAKMLSSKCDAMEVAGPGETLPPLPVQPAVPTSKNAPNNNRPELRTTPSNVTNYLDPAAYSPDFEYWVTAWSDPPGTVHEGQPIDESVAAMLKDKFVCAGSQHVAWDAAGSKGSAPDRVDITERYVVECVGDCKGVFYRPYVGANVTHFGLSAPLPTMQIRSTFFGGASFRWNFSRTNKSQPPPEIYIHRWKPGVGFGPADPGPAELARRQAAAPPCRASKASNR